MVLTGWEGIGAEPPIKLGCLALYTINVVGPNGENLGNTVDFNQIGKTLNYSIKHATNGFTCWNTVKIEDKIKPTITCLDITVNCLADITKLVKPVTDDNCPDEVAVLVNEVHTVLNCDPKFIGTVTQTWKGVDKYGNESATNCTRTIYLKRSDFSLITFPANVKLECSSAYPRDTKGFDYPSPLGTNGTGVPKYNGVAIFPMSALNMQLCNALIDYTDQLIVDTKCKKKIMRTWAITEWWCSTSVVYNMPPQIIDIVDETAPLIPALANITVTTQTRSCDGALDLPKLNITDNCNDVVTVYINATTNGNASGYLGANGGKMILGLGTHSVTYSALDFCGNKNEMTYRITVQDKTEPIALCDQFTTVSIKTNGYTEVTAAAIDDGSFDECGPVTLKVRRMEDPCNFGADTAWYNKVGFCCLDADKTRMVQLLVTDVSGNTNICMVSVNVQEKVDPTIVCPSDRTINDCLYTFDPANASAHFGNATIIDNCPANNILGHSLVDKRTNCGTGVVERTFTVSNNGITYGTCKQTITFRNLNPFNGNNTAELKWPKDYLALGQCSFGGLLPEMLPDSSSAPKITEDACDMVAMRYVDQVFPFTTNGACYKIIRTWTVIDWCQTGTANTWTHEQEIKVMDNIKPTITSTVQDRLVCTYDNLCLAGNITLTASATDCTPAAELKWTYTVTRNGVSFRTGNTNNASGSYPIGKYRVRFTVEDRCGNLSETAYNFEVRNCTGPTAICKQGLAASLTMMDTNGDGIGDTPMTMLRPSFFDTKSSHICGYAVKLSFSVNVNDTLEIFDCDELGRRPIELWVTDINGNTGKCITFVDIQAAPGLCPSNLLANVSGKTVKENNEEIQSVTVEMKGSEFAPVTTNANGQYAFAPMGTGGTYQIIPSKRGDDMNGVSTLDLVMIQRHILGLEKLTTPYKLIAADINKNGKVSASDLTELRKMILGLYTSFPENTSWRFIDAAYKFPDVNDPWVSTLPEQYNIDKLNGSMDINFVGIKVGDVNGNASGKILQDGHLENRSKAIYQMTDRQVVTGEIIEILVYAEANQILFGMQMQITSKDLSIKEIKSGKLNIRTDDYLISNNETVAMSFASGSGNQLQKDEVLFIVKAEVLRSGLLSEKIALGKEMHNEVYINNSLETKSMNLGWRNNPAQEFILAGNNPNPWNTNTNITFELPSDGMVTLKVKDFTGRSVVSQVNQFTAGKNTINLIKSDLGHPGVYIYELRYEDKVLTGRMIMIE